MTWALIGASTIAATYMIDALCNAPGGRLAGMLSSDPLRGASYAERHGIPRVYESFEELCDDGEVDAVYVSTANARHAAQALTAIAAGKHVLCEKPLAVTVADARAVVAAAADAGVVLGVNHHLRSAAAHLKVRDLIATGSIGRVLGARVFHGTELPPDLRTWRIGAPDAGAGAALDLTVHGADLLRFMLDEEIDEVAAFSARQGVSSHVEVEDAIVGVLRTRSGTLATFHDAFTMPCARTCLELYGDAGVIQVQDAMADDPIASVTLTDVNGVRRVALGRREGLYERSVRLFNDAVRGRGKPAATGEDGLRSLLVARAALEAAREPRPVRVEYVT